MPRLKSLDRHVPGDFQMIHAEANQAEPFKGSFYHVCREEHKFRRLNPFLAQKYGWSLEMEQIEKDVHDYNVQRCLAHGWLDFLDMGTGTYTPLQQPPEKKMFRSAVAAVETTKAGIGVWMDHMGPSGVPVAQKTADERAAICATCPHNKQGGLKNWFVQKAADEIMHLFGIFKDLDVKTKYDDKLGVCELCVCPLKNKVQVEMHHIQKHLTPEVREKLAAVKHCWVNNG